MEMEVVVPVRNHPMDFNFDSACSSPYMTAPSSPQRFGNFFFSAPTSPTRATAFYNDLHNLSLIDDINPRYSSSSIPFKWEEKPGTPKCSTRASDSINHGGDRDGIHDDNQDFEFNFSGQLDITSLSAEELFDGGKIKPLKPPPRLHVGGGGGGNGTATTAAAGTEFEFSSTLTSPRSPRSPRSRISQGKKMVQEALSPRQKKDFGFDPFSAAIEETRRKGNQEQQHEVEEKRGRPGRSSSGFVRKGTRSLSPLRVSDIVMDAEYSSSMEKTVSPTTRNAKPSTSSSSSSSSSAYSSILSAISFSKGYRKWRLKDFLLFRSASEGRATSKDPLRKYAVLSKKSIVADDLKNSSFRSTESVGSVSSRRRGPVSAHEMHYTMNRAVSEEMRKKTVLPYKHGLLGCLGFNHGVQEISRSFGSLTRG